MDEEFFQVLRKWSHIVDDTTQQSVPTPKNLQDVMDHKAHKFYTDENPKKFNMRFSKKSLISPVVC